MATKKGKTRKPTSGKDLAPRPRASRSVKGGTGGGPVTPIRRVRDKLDTLASHER